MNFVNQIITETWALTGNDEMNAFSLTFSPPIQSTLEDFKKRPKPGETQPTTQQEKAKPEPEQDEDEQE
jgi:hypothetical protein